jgi:hypothetical protein
MNECSTGLRFVALPTDQVRAYQRGAPDANGQAPERHLSDGDGVPCRHCLANVAARRPYLILAHRPFPAPQPYAEIGPIFLHAEPCERHLDSGRMPAMFRRWPRLLIRGYDRSDRIVYGSGQVAETAAIEPIATALLERPEIAYLHLRSAANNCYQCRIERAT